MTLDPEWARADPTDPGATPSLTPIESLLAPPGGVDNHVLFAPGEIVAERFAVVDIIGLGGMGQIFRARDLELHQEVALKVLRPEIARDARAVERFRAEARLAKQVTHPNVCRIFDVFHHRPPDGRGPLLVLAMELLRGEPLSARLRRQGGLPIVEGLPIVCQIAAAMEAAHRAGVLHLDLKSSNVLLVPGAAGERVVVTDFGVARALAEGGQEGRVGGTPSHMAPEQLADGPLAVTTDVFAFGVLLDEILHGVPLSRRARGPLSSTWPSAGPDSSPLGSLGWRAAIRRATDPRPEARFQSVGELVAALQPAWKRAASRSGGVLALGLALTAALIAARSTTDPRAPMAAGPKPTPEVLLLPLAATSSTAEPLATDLEELLANELESGHRVRLVREVLAEEELPGTDGRTGPCQEGCLESLRARFGITHAIAGAVELKAQQTVTIRLFTSQPGKPSASPFEASASTTELDSLVERAGVRLRDALGVDPPSAEDREAWRRLLPPDTTTFHAWATGIRLLRRGEARPAAGLLRAVTRGSPGFAMGHVALADALSATGHMSAAATEYRAALPYGAGLPAGQLLLIQARAHEAEFRWDAAAAIYESLWAAPPRNVDHGLSLARVQAKAGRPLDALATLDTIRTGARNGSSDLRLHLAEADAAAAATDWKRSRSAAQRAIAAAERRGSRAEMIVARRSLGRSLLESGERAAAAEQLRLALDLALESHDSRGAAATLLQLAHLDRDQGDFDAAERRYREVMLVARRMGNPETEALARRGLAVLFLRMGKPEDAAAHHQAALDMFRRAGHLQLESLTLNSLALIAQDRGDYDQAIALFEQALELMQRVGAKQGLGAIVENMAAAQWTRGRLLDSLAGFERALALLEPIGDSGVATTLAAIAHLNVELGRLPEAQRTLARAWPLARSTPLALGWLRLAEGTMLLERGDLRAAEGALQSALAASSAVKDSRAMGYTLSTLADSALAADDPRLARERALEAVSACGAAADELCRQVATAALAEIAWQAGDVRACQDHLASLERAVDFHAVLLRRRLAALVLAENGGVDEAARQLRELVGDAARTGLLRERFAAELALASLARRLGRSAEAGASLSSVERDSSDLGLGLWEGRARRARSDPAHASPLSSAATTTGAVSAKAPNRSADS